uniref:Uncharacterized protein n=1 Tax=Aegilops tauschii TaxID=37682 RepID=M8C0Q6_AEGTA
MAAESCMGKVLTCEATDSNSYWIRLTGPSAAAGPDSSCAVVVGFPGGSAGQRDSGGKRKESPTQSEGQVEPRDLKVESWTCTSG